MFVPALKRFIKHSNGSKDNSSLLILDNVRGHLTVEAIRLAKDNCVTLLTVPPHTTHKTQPLVVRIWAFPERLRQQRTCEPLIILERQRPFMMLLVL